MYYLMNPTGVSSEAKQSIYPGFEVALRAGYTRVIPNMWPDNGIEIHAFFISNTYISNTRLRLAYFETRILENNGIWTMRLFQNDCTRSK